MMKKSRLILIRYLLALLPLLCAAPLLWYGTRVFVTDRFVIKGLSMEPTLHTGQGVWVNKLRMGPRLYTKFDFASPELHCIRLPGFRRLRVGDVAVFNYPYARGGDSIAFRINLVYCKRCWGVPGDTVRIRDGEFSASLGSGHRYRAGAAEAAARLRSVPDSVLLARRSLKAGQFAGEGERWTVKDFGPIVVPKRGMTIRLDSLALRRYARVIAWERKRQGAAEAPPLPAAGDAAVYTFRQDWYFFVGDNLVDSRDSRYFGFVPADFVVGVIPGL